MLVGKQGIPLWFRCFESVDTDEPWILATNKNPTRAKKDYGYRFGGIKSIFKNQKSNGFYLENSIACTL